MTKEKKSISVTITDVDNIYKVFESLDILFQKIMYHYIDEKKTENLTLFVLTIASYIGQTMRVLGIDETFLEDKK